MRASSIANQQKEITDNTPIGNLDQSIRRSINIYSIPGLAHPGRVGPINDDGFTVIDAIADRTIG